MEVGVWADSPDDEQVSKNSDQVHGEEKSEHERLQFWILWKSHEKKFWNSCYVPWCHVLEVTARKEETKWLIMVQTDITHVAEMPLFIFCC